MHYMSRLIRSIYSKQRCPNNMIVLENADFQNAVYSILHTALIVNIHFILKCFNTKMYVLKETIMFKSI